LAPAASEMLTEAVTFDVDVSFLTTTSVLLSFSSSRSLQNSIITGALMVWGVEAGEGGEDIRYMISIDIEAKGYVVELRSRGHEVTLKGQGGYWSGELLKKSFFEGKFKKSFYF
jgi:hypothetical protein